VDNIERQVALYLQGAEFGDAQIKETMTRELQQRLIEAQEEGRPLRVYCGYDVTAPDIHLGHTITMSKLRQFQEFGHEVSFVIGTFTTLIGDPSDRDRARASAIPEEVQKNAQTYAQQAFKILDPVKTTVRYNHEWLGKLTFTEVIELASFFSVQQFLARDRLQNRLIRNEPLWLRELFYPLAQGYDAVHLRADVQIGGTEQLFNLMAGRRLQEACGQKPQICLAFPLLPGIDGVNKMSKSLGNYIGVSEDPDSQYGKVMNLPDSLVMLYFSLVTRWTPDQIAGLEEGLRAGRLHPMEAKKRLAFEIVEIFHGPEAAGAAADNFQRIHQSRELPAEMPEFPLNGPVNILDLLVQTGLCASKSEARRVIGQGGIKIDRRTVSRVDEIVEPGEAVLQKGQRNFIRLTVR
jgi:tyrosyl-tRNA synthetase